MPYPATGACAQLRPASAAAATSAEPLLSPDTHAHECVMHSAAVLYENGRGNGLGVFGCFLNVAWVAPVKQAATGQALQLQVQLVWFMYTCSQATNGRRLIA
jgi:hypothetical protein